MIRIGSGAGFAGDRLLPAVELIEAGVDYLGLECLAERTISMAQQRKRAEGAGYGPLFEDRLRAVLGPAADAGTTVVTNAGAADPAGAGRAAADIAAEVGVDLPITVMTGDDCTRTIRERADEFGIGGDVVSANAYLGAEQLADAIRRNGDGPGLVIAGRVADPSLFLAPMVVEFGWDLDDWGRLGQGTVVGHLLECAGLVTGGYFMEPGRKEVPDPHRLGFPYAEVEPDGAATLAKPEGTGGRLDRHTCREQLFYEVHDPSAYLTPDVTADFTGVDLDEVGEDRVRVSGGTGRERPGDLKVSVGVHEGYQGSAYMAYGAPNAEARAELAGEIVRRRVEEVHDPDPPAEIRVDLVGRDALYGEAGEPLAAGPAPEVELRVTAAAESRETVHLVLREAYALYNNGPASGGGFHPEDLDGAIGEVVGIESAFLPRDEVTRKVEYGSVGAPGVPADD